MKNHGEKWLHPSLVERTRHNQLVRERIEVQRNAQYALEEQKRQLVTDEIQRCGLISFFKLEANRPLTNPRAKMRGCYVLLHIAVRKLATYGPMAAPGIPQKKTLSFWASSLNLCGSHSQPKTAHPLNHWFPLQLDGPRSGGASL